MGGAGGRAGPVTGPSAAALSPQVRGREPACPRPCGGRCPAQPPRCAPGVPAVLDGCSCCLVCARQRGESCSPLLPCDESSGLYCDRGPEDGGGAAGICMGRWRRGGPVRRRRGWEAGGASPACGSRAQGGGETLPGPGPAAVSAGGCRCPALLPPSLRRSGAFSGLRRAEGSAAAAGRVSSVPPTPGTGRESAVGMPSALCLSEIHSLFSLVLEGDNCVFDGMIYRNGETFQPSCKYQCTCRDGQIGCLPRCNLDLLLPGPDCPFPRKVEVPGECCEKWICDPKDEVILGGFAMAGEETKTNYHSHCEEEVISYWKYTWGCQI